MSVEGAVPRTELAKIAPVSDALFQAARVHRIIARQLLKDTGLYPGQEILMLRLWQDGQLELAELIASLGLDPSTVTRMVQRLEKAGLVVRSRSPRDRRAVLVQATAASEPLRTEVLAAWQRLESSTVRGLDAEDRELLITHLKGVTTSLESGGR